MNSTEVTKFYTLAMCLDQRMRPLDDQDPTQVEMWAYMLEDVPYLEARHILKALYRRTRKSILQPGDITEAWETIQETRRETVERIRKIDNYLTRFGADDPDEIVNAKLTQRHRLIKTLPQHVITNANLDHPPIEPRPTTYYQDPQTSEPIDFGQSLHSV